MRRTASEKMEMIRLVEGTDMPVRATLRQLGVPRSTFYGWFQRYLDDGFDGLHDKKPAPRGRWNAIPEKIQKSSVRISHRESWLGATPTRGATSCPNRAFIGF